MRNAIPQIDREHRAAVLPGTPTVNVDAIIAQAHGARANAGARHIAGIIAFFKESFA